MGELTGFRGSQRTAGAVRKAPPASGAQRRHLTILFCDLVGSTELSLQMEPDDLHELIQSYLEACTRELEALGGFVARYMGDGVLAYFGYPVAREDDARRAVHAAMKVREGAGQLVTPRGAALQVRTGIATGDVVVGDLIGSGPAEERPVVGQAANLAARLQSVAGPGEVMVCPTTATALGGRFLLSPTRPLTLKGFPDGLVAWTVGAEQRLPQPRPGAPAPRFVGRRGELDALASAYRRAETGRSQVVTVIGEAGAGKSRLLSEFRSRSSRRGRPWLQGSGAQMFSNTPFHAAAEIVRQQLLGAAPDPEAARKRLPRSLARAGQRGPEAYSLVAELLGIATTDEDAPLALDAEHRRRRLLSVLCDCLLTGGDATPKVIVVEDLHWADPSTLELVDLLVARRNRTRLLLVLTSREESLIPPRAARVASTIRLQPLTADEARELADGASAGLLQPSLLDAVVARAQGVPLFAEELARFMVQEGAAAYPGLPPTLASLLTARLDQAGPARSTAQMASILGTEFDPAVLRAILRMSAADFGAHVERLTDSGLLESRGPAGAGTLAFRHALIRDAAYHTILKAPRRALHARAAEVISTRFAKSAAARPEILAQHWSQAGDPQRATEAWMKAAQLAATRRAFEEALRAYDLAAAELEAIPAEDERRARELEVHGAVAGVLQIARGYSAPETLAATARARLLAEQQGDSERHARQLANACFAASSAGRYDEAARLVAQFLPLALAEGSPERAGVAAMMQMTTLYRMGELARAEETFLGARRVFSTAAFLRQRGGPGPQTYGNAALIACLAGRPAEALRRIARAQNVRRSADPAYDRAFSSFMAATLALLMDDPAAAERFAAEARELSDQAPYPQFRGTSRIALGAAQARLGGAPAGAALISEGLEAMQADGARAGLSMYLTWLAEAQLGCDDLQAAAATIEQALQINPQERFYRPATLCVAADLKWRTGDLEGAQAACAEALSLAREMEARALHQRALEVLRRLKAGGTNGGAGAKARP